MHERPCGLRRLCATIRGGLLDMEFRRLTRWVGVGVRLGECVVILFLPLWVSGRGRECRACDFRLQVWYFVLNPVSCGNEILRLERSCRHQIRPPWLVASIDRITARRKGSACEFIDETS